MSTRPRAHPSHLHLSSFQSKQAQQAQQAQQGTGMRPGRQDLAKGENTPGCAAHPLQMLMANLSRTQQKGSTVVPRQQWSSSPKGREESRATVSVALGASVRMSPSLDSAPDTINMGCRHPHTSPNTRDLPRMNQGQRKGGWEAGTMPMAKGATPQGVQPYSYHHFCSLIISAKILVKTATNKQQSANSQAQRARRETTAPLSCLSAGEGSLCIHGGTKRGCSHEEVG